MKRVVPPLLALAVLAGCSKQESAPPLAPEPPPPPVVRAMAPEPRSVFVDYQTEIWAEFAEPLDPSTVTTENVYLKVDTRRQSIDVTWDPATLRVLIHPLTTLALFTTYTVEFSPNLAAADGTPLGTAYRWQFTTTSVRHPSTPYPLNRSIDSPYTALSFGGNETTPGSLVYEVYTGPDSAVVAARSLPYLYRGNRTFYLPRTRWAEHAANFWSVTVENTTVGERSNGAVWRFDTPAADVPVDSISVAALEWGYRRGSFFSGACSSPELFTGDNYFAGIGWAVVQQPQTLKLAGARMELSATTAYQGVLPGGAGLWLTNNFVRCSNGLVAATDETNGLLATAEKVGPRTVRYESDPLAIHLQASIRLRTFYGYLYRSTTPLHFVAPQGAEPGFVPVLKLYVYQLGATAEMHTGQAAGAGPRVARPHAGRGRGGVRPVTSR